MPNSLEITAANRADLPLLEDFLTQGGPAKHTGRVARQERGDVVYLIAWRGERPLGHALLKWKGSDDAAVAGRLNKECPDIEDLFVVEDARRCGVGTRLLRAAEHRVLERNIRRVGLSVGVETNDPARRLYERLGYRDAGFGPYLEQGEYRGADGEIHRWQELCVYLFKELGD